VDHVHILLVEDNADSREIMRATLRYCGARVTDVPSVRKAVEALLRVRPDVIVSDLEMPEEDAFAFMRQVRSNHRLRTIPAIAVTAYEFRFPHDAVIAAGFDVVMGKPFDPPELVRTVAKLLAA
jgi:CheY-like chemotaxis protein